MQRCCLANLLDGKPRRDRHSHLVGRDRSSDLGHCVGRGVVTEDCARAAGRVGAGGDGDDAAGGDAESQCGFDGLGAEEVNRGGDPTGSRRAYAILQACAVRDRSAPRSRRKGNVPSDAIPTTVAPASRASCTTKTPTPPAAPPTRTVSAGPRLSAASTAAAVAPATASVLATSSLRS